MEALKPTEALEALSLFMRAANSDQSTVLAVGHYLDAAIAKIDNCFGRGYASGRPQLIAAFMQTLRHRFHRWHARARDKPSRGNHSASN
jgi:hypothetical protein